MRSSMLRTRIYIIHRNMAGNKYHKRHNLFFSKILKDQISQEIGRI
jgi:hypothetical protein